jgi:DNA invertase Pin-like site-specific DNA recombinase
MRAAIYARVSSAKQRDERTIESQLLELRAYLASQGWELFNIYIDDGRSAKTGMLERRDGFAQLMRDAEAGRFDILVVLDVNRLTRTGSIEERAEILGPFQRLGIQIATPSTGIQDLRSFLGEFWVTVQALVAAEENRKRAVAIQAGKARAIAEGRKPAGPTPYGLHYARLTGTWSIDEVAAAIVREIYRRVIAGESCQEIADDLHSRGVRPPRGPWERHKVWAIVRSRTAVGEWTADKRQRLVVAVPAIVDERTWQQAQAALMLHGKRGIQKTKHVYLLEGIAKCSVCGSPIAIRSATHVKRRGYRNPPAYVCRARKIARIGEERCCAPILRVADVDARVWATVQRELEDPALAAEVERRLAARAEDRHDWAADAKSYRSRLERIARAEAGILARYRAGSISDEALDIELAGIARERSAIQHQLQVAERATTDPAGLPEIEPGAFLKALREIAAEDSPIARQRIVRAILKADSVVFDGQRVKFTLLVQASQAALARPNLRSVASG